MLVRNLSARYSADGPEVLKNVSFHLQSGQRMGIGKDFSVKMCIVLRNDILQLVGQVQGNLQSRSLFSEQFQLRDSLPLTAPTYRS